MFNHSAPIPRLKRFASALLVGLAASAIALFGASPFSTAHIARAASYVVTSNLDSGTGTLRAEIALALADSTADTITFASSVTSIQLSSGQLNISGGSNTSLITIDGGTGVTINGVNTGSTTFEPFFIGTGKNIILQNLTIQDGATYNGGGVYNVGTLSINQSTISGNEAYDSGGGVYNTGILTISHSTVSGNKSDQYSGGGVSNSGTLSISSSILSGNGTSDSGAGVYNTGDLLISNSTFDNNNSYSFGGDGGALDNEGKAGIVSGTFSSNSAFGAGVGAGVGGEGYGGAVYNNGTLTSINSTFFGNSASGKNDSSGGGDAYGGAIYNKGGSLSIGNSTIVGNAVSSRSGSSLNGGGVAVGGGTVALFSTIVSGNTLGDTYGAITDAGYNLIGGATYLDSGLNQNGAPASVPQTLAITDTRSNAYGRGNCGGTTAVSPGFPAILLDERAFSRKSPRCDIGAYENQIPLTIANIDTIGIFRPGSPNGTNYLRLYNSTGSADLQFAALIATRPAPIVGDWTGAGYDTAGVYDQANGAYSLRNSNNAGAVDEQLVFGNPNDSPIAGRWTSTATHAGVGVLRPSNGILYAKNDLTTGYSDDAGVLGNPGDQGIAGDWTGIGQDGVGVFRPANQTFYMVNQVANGILFSNLSARLGNSTDLAIVGNWTGMAHDGIGVFRPGTGQVFLENVIGSGTVDNSFLYGTSTDIPVVGHWQGIYPSPVPPPAPTHNIVLTVTPDPNPNNGSVSGGNQIGG